MPLTPSEPSGRGRAAIGDLTALLRAWPATQTLQVTPVILIERWRNEETPEDFLNNPRRRVGRVHDLAEQIARDPSASNCTKPTIFGHAASDPLTLAEHRQDRSGLDVWQESTVARFWCIEISAKGFSESGLDAGLRIADCTGPGSSSFQALDNVGHTPDSELWRERERVRSRDCLVGEFRTNEVDEQSVLLLSLHAIAQLYEEGMITITADEAVISSRELQKTTVPDRMRRAYRTVRGWMAEIAFTSEFVVEIVAAVAAVGVALHFLLGLF